LPHFEQTFEHAGPDLAAVAINAGFNDTPTGVREFQKKHSITIPMMIVMANSAKSSIFASLHSTSSSAATDAFNTSVSSRMSDW
jgi:hypothetical protein